MKTMAEKCVVDERALRRAQAGQDFLDCVIEDYRLMGAKIVDGKREEFEAFKGHQARRESDIGTVASVNEAGKKLIGAFGDLVAVEAGSQTEKEVKTYVVSMTAGPRKVVMTARLYADEGVSVFEAEVLFNDGDGGCDKRTARSSNDSRATRQIYEFLEAGLEALTSPNTYLAGSYRK